MSVSTFESLSADILFEIFGYLSPVDVLQAFLSFNKHLSRIIIHEYLWHIHIGNSTMPLSMFNNLCQNVLKLIGGRLVSLRLTLSDALGGWSLVSLSLQYHQTTLLQRLHLIGIEPHEFDKLLHNHLLRQLHTLLVDVEKSSSFHYQIVEGVYLAKVRKQTLFQLSMRFRVISSRNKSSSIINKISLLYLYKRHVLNCLVYQFVDFHLMSVMKNKMN